jgi:hypothetical protein
MTDKKKLQEQADELQAKLDDLKAEIAKPDGEWPQDGDVYFLVNGRGGVATYEWCYDTIDRGASCQGRIFRTKAEAELFSRQERVMAKLRGMAKGFVPDWGFSSYYACTIYFNHNTKRWNTIRADACERPGAVYFASEADAHTAIDALGDELDVLL